MNKDDIKYLTLIELGYNTRPEFINSEDNGVNLINDQYDFVMNLALTSYNWSFATKRVELTSELNTNNNKYKYQYFLPEDVLFVRGVYGDDKFRSSIKDFEIYDKRVFIDETTCFADYTKKIVESNMPSWFIDYFKNLLARKLCMNVTGDKELLQLLMMNEQTSYAEAKNADMKQRAVQIMPNGAFITVRG